MEDEKVEVVWYRQGVNLVPVDEVYYSVYYAPSYVVEGENVLAANVVVIILGASQMSQHGAPKCTVGTRVDPRIDVTGITRVPLNTLEPIGPR